MKVLVTGAHGFIGRNLSIRLRERPDLELITFVKGESESSLATKVAEVSFIFHLAGVNRPQRLDEFQEGNARLTEMLADKVRTLGRSVPILFTSSLQADSDNMYGRSKRDAEAALRRLSEMVGAPCYIYRLPNVFGKWSRPNYNSVVATFCYNVARDLPIEVHDPNATLRLAYIDDVISDFLRIMERRPEPNQFEDLQPVYHLTVGELAAHIRTFMEMRHSLTVGPVGVGLIRALYATYLTYLPDGQFSYPLKKYQDHRGIFVELLKSHDSGQLSYFTAYPGVTRGGHYHHSKTEKFLVVKGSARFRFRHIDSGAFYECCTSAVNPTVVETIPGWSHDITNIGPDEMVVVLWANEVFNRAAPDTIISEVTA